MLAALHRMPPTRAESVTTGSTSAAPPQQRYAEGANYDIDVEDVLAVCRVRSRRDLTMLEGARLAGEKVTLFRALATGKQAVAMLFDLSAAPAVIGPKTQEALEKRLACWQLARKPIALVAGSNAMQQLQLRRLVSNFADCAAVFETEPAARDWLRARVG
jgi:hypothetical protein